MRQVLLFIFIASLAVYPVKAEDPESLIGQGNDGNRSGPVHVIELLDGSGKKIRAKDADPKPFSTRKTCGKCHNTSSVVST